MMQHMGFNEKNYALVKECIDNVSYSVLTNCSPKGFIHSNRGIKQRDPLSPYLFTISN